MTVLPAFTPGKSYLSPRVEKRKSKIGGWGIFAKEPIKKGDLICIWRNHLIAKSDVARMEKYLGTFPLQISKDWYVGPLSRKDLDEAEFFNHSCNPNAGIKGRRRLVAREDIPVGGEVTFDYSTSDIDLMKFKCLCGSPNCRGIVSCKEYLNPTFQKDNWVYLSSYIKKILQQPQFN